MSDSDPVVGHKTFMDWPGVYRHEPLRKSEADALMAALEEEKAQRAAKMPDELTAINVMFEAWYRLKELGWKEAIYCPKDGSSFNVIEPGSTGIHRAHYDGEWPNGHWWIESDDDLCPSHPILFKP